MVREAARRLSRDVKAVHTDLSAHLSACILSRTETGQVESCCRRPEARSGVQPPDQIAARRDLSLFVKRHN